MAKMKFRERPLKLHGPMKHGKHKLGPDSTGIRSNAGVSDKWVADKGVDVKTGRYRRPKMLGLRGKGHTLDDRRGNKMDQGIHQAMTADPIGEIRGKEIVEDRPLLGRVTRIKTVSYKGAKSGNGLGTKRATTLEE